MADVERRTLASLDAGERAELERAMRESSDAYVADNQDIVVVWLVMIAAGLGLIGVGLVGGLPLPVPHQLLALPGLALVAWAAYLWLSTHGKRGVVFTQHATWLVRGESLTGVRHAKVSQLKQRSIQRPGRSFTVLALHADDSTVLTLYVQRRWAAAAVAAIQAGAGKHVHLSSL